MAKTKTKMLSFLSDEELEARIRKECAACNVERARKGVPIKLSLSAFIREAVIKEMNRAEKRRKA